MTTIRITPQGLVTGSNDALVAAAAAILCAVPMPRAATTDRMNDLVAAVSLSWARIPVQQPSAA